MAMLVYTDPSGRELSVPIGPDHPVVSIGRATDCTIRSNRKSVSRRHAEFHYSNGRFEVIDLNSSNGTYIIIDDERKPVIQPESLTHSDEVWCGDFILHFYEDDEMAGAVSGAMPQTPAEDSYAVSRPTHNFGQNYSPGDPLTGQIRGGVYPGNVSSPNVQVGGVQAGASGFGQRPHSGGFASPQAPTGLRPQAGVPQEFGNMTGMGESSFVPGELPRSPSEVERLRDEKRAIEELAARQANEIEILRAELETAKEEVDALRNLDAGDDEMLARELEEARQEQERLANELRMTQESAGPAIEAQLEAERDKARQTEGQLKDATAKIDDLRRHLTHVESDARQRQAALSEEIETLRQQLKTAQAKARDAQAQSDQSEEVEALRRDLQRQERLLEEFEKRSRESQKEADEQRARAEKAEARLDGTEDDLTRVSADLKSAEAQLAEANQQLQAMASLEAANAALRREEEDLRGQMEGLKQRLRLEKQRARQAGVENVEGLQTEIEALRHELDTLKGAGALAGQELTEMVQKLTSLDRMIDAIERADLEELSTVDRVRLRSALRDCRPRETLAEILTTLRPSAK